MDFIPGFGISTSGGSEMSARDKRTLSNVEKALNSFEFLEEWADYIAFLSRLQKLMALPAETPHLLSWIPLAEQVLAKLALCLLPLLPNGVHRKSLELYEMVFDALDAETLNKQISIWLPGILPVVSFGSMQVKPQVIKLYEKCLLTQLTAQSLKSVTTPLLLALLCGLDDENSEVFSDVMMLVDAFKAKLANDAHFWLLFFVCIITSPEKRLGALNWCVARLPVFTVAKDDTKETKEINGFSISAEAHACLTPEPGLLVRAFAAALNTRSSFNQANDIIVMRGFFDLLLSNLPLDSPVMSHVVSLEDKQLLLMASCRATLKKDMSLNRRLWKWLLGPERGEEAVRSEDQKAYFAANALPVLLQGLKTLVASTDVHSKIDAYNITLAMIMDRWEISQLVTPQLFVPIIESCFSAVNLNMGKSSELLAAGKRFFDEVETYYIWRYLIHDLLLGSESTENSNLDLVEFLLKSFEFPEESSTGHGQLAALAFLLKYDVTERNVSILELLMDLLPVRFESKDGKFNSDQSKSNLTSVIADYYSKLTPGDGHTTPISIMELPLLLARQLEDWYIQSLGMGRISFSLSSLLCGLLASSPDLKSISRIDDGLLKRTFLDYPEFSWKNLQEIKDNASTVLGIVKLYPFLSSDLIFSEKSKMLKIILSNLWATLVSLYPTNHQVEAVRCIFDLRVAFDVNEIEAGLSYMVLQTPEKKRLTSFYKLWSLAQGLNDSENLLSSPLFVVLDSLRNVKPENLLEAQKFVYNVCTDGSANQFLKIVTNPLLTFSIVKKTTTHIDTRDDFKLFAYYLDTILNLLHSNEKVVKEVLTHEFVSAGNVEKFELFTTNDWDVSNYKSLLINIIQKSMTLQLSPSILQEARVVVNFSECLSKALELYSTLISGSEPDLEAHFNLILSSCNYFVFESGIKDTRLEVVQSVFIKYIHQFLDTAKSMNTNILRFKKEEKPGSAPFIAFINRGIEQCTSPTLLEKWFSLMKVSLYLLDGAIFGEMLNFNHTIIEKTYACFAQIKKFNKLLNCSDTESILSICLSGLEDLLSITHSYLLTPNQVSAAKVQQSENGFFGNVISGVFQIESPLVKSEEEQRQYAVIFAFQDAIKAVYSIWSWADSKPHMHPESPGYCSQESISHMANKLKFRSKKLLGSLSDLERQETIETILETHTPMETKIKILHVLDSGHSQLSLPHILNSILTRCSPLGLAETQKSSMYSSVTEKQLCEFLVPYYASIDTDTLDEIWEMSISFFKEVSLHPVHFRLLLVTILQIMKIVSLKAQARKINDSRRNLRELTSYFLNVLNAAATKKSLAAAAEKESESGREESESEENHIEGLTSIVGTLGEVIPEQERIITAVTTIISTVILSQAKPKVAVVAPSVLKLILEIGKSYPIKAWKQIIYETFMEKSFFENEKYYAADWREIIALWISNDKERMDELVGKITPPVQSSAANIFIWNESSEVEDRAMVLRRISYLVLVLPKDFFVKNLEDIMNRLGTALNSSCPAVYKSEALNVFRALCLKNSEGHLLPYWSMVTQNLVEVFSGALAKSSKEFSGIATDELALIFSACKLLDQLLLLQFDEVNLTSWLFVSRGFDPNDGASNSLIDRLALKSETLLTKEDPISIIGPQAQQKSKPLLLGVTSVKNIAFLKKFFGLLSYINFERCYGLAEPDVTACEADLLRDMGR